MRHRRQPQPAVEHLKLITVDLERCPVCLRYMNPSTHNCTGTGPGERTP